MAKRFLYYLSKYSRPTPLPNEKSLNFIIPIIILAVIGVIYLMSQKAYGDFSGFILIGIGAITTIYWVKVIKKMTKNVTAGSKFTTRETEAKNWVYDLIKGDNQFVFVSEVPGPDDKIMVRLIDGILSVRGSGGFSKEIVIENSNEMQISDFKYRNGVLTLRIN